MVNLLLTFKHHISLECQGNQPNCFAHTRQLSIGLRLCGMEGRSHNIIILSTAPPNKILCNYFLIASLRLKIHFTIFRMKNFRKNSFKTGVKTATFFKKNHFQKNQKIFSLPNPVREGDFTIKAINLRF